MIGEYPRQKSINPADSPIDGFFMKDFFSGVFFQIRPDAFPFYTASNTSFISPCIQRDLLLISVGANASP